MKTDIRCKKKKNTVFKLRMNDTLRKKLNQDAKLAGLNQSEYIRRLIQGRQIISSGQRKQVDQLIYELNRIGNNINQIAHALNFGYISYQDMQDLKIYQRELQETMKKILVMWSK